MITTTKKDPKESTESLLRRFNRKVQQSGILAEVKLAQFHHKDMSKRDRRRRAVVRRDRKGEKDKKATFNNK